MKRLSHWAISYLERAFPEQRVFLRSDTETKFIRLKPWTQAVAWTGSALFVGWAIVATAILLMDSIGSGSLRDQAVREQRLYEERMNALSTERDARAKELRDAQERFNAALAQISTMQSELLSLEDRRKELETGIGVIQATLRRTIKERDAAREEVETAIARAEGAEDAGKRANSEDADTSLDFLTAAITELSEERDLMAAKAAKAISDADEIALEKRLLEEKNNAIFSQLEDAVSVSIEPIDSMFSAVGLSSESILESVRRGYSGQGGPLSPIKFSTKGEEPDPDSIRANAILQRMDRLNLYRLAIEKTPFGMPVKNSYRFTSGFGPRWGRMHSGSDFAAAHGTPIYTTADGVVTHAGWQSGYGRLIKIQHEFGIETRYAHLAKIHVNVGQRVSRGDRIGDMGSSGRSTGTHLHYEVRIGGKAVNPMTYIKAARDVF